ncbi:MAG: hypothetical protein BWX69_02275 [Planctomycetes bacterium ADurb.Bin069]|nr:MAG: hypothetical protein BWX69_02275 [Planctomycetes bacterium ADurb.Bin069]
MVRALGPSGTVDRAVVEQNLPVAVQRLGEGARAGHPMVEVAVVPRRHGGVNVGVGGVRAELRLDGRRVIRIELDGLGGLHGIAAGPGRPELAFGRELDEVGIPVRIDRREVGVVGVEAREPAEGLLVRDEVLERLVTAALGRCHEPHREALPAVAPGDLVVALGEAPDAVGAQARRARLLPGVVLGTPGFLPQPRSGLAGVGGRRVGNRGQDLLVDRRHREEDALEEIVAPPVGLGIIARAAHAPSPEAAACIEFEVRLGIGLGGIAAIPVRPGGHEESSGAFRPVEQHGRVARAVGQKGNRKEFPRGEGAEVAEPQLRRLAADTGYIPEEGFLEQPEGVLDLGPRALPEDEAQNAVFQRRRDSAPRARHAG